MADATFRLSLSDLPDIIYHVFSYLDPIHYSVTEAEAARQSLAMVARTCRGFTDPALNVLWRRLPSDGPLVDLLRSLGIAAPGLKRKEDQSFDESYFWSQPFLEALARTWTASCHYYPSREGYDIQYVSVPCIREHIRYLHCRPSPSQ